VIAALVLLLASAFSQTQRNDNLNLLGQANTSQGESRRNENIQFNLVDNNALKELNVRLGAVVTLFNEFSPERRHYGAEYGVAPASLIHLPFAKPRPWHGEAHFSHLNSVTTARTFFQVGDVQPARENEYGFRFALLLWRGANLSLDAGQRKIRGQVNGNVLAPSIEERTPLATDPAVRAIVARFLGAYPALPPNRTDINPRALNTNSPQSIDDSNSALKLDQRLSARDRLALQHVFTTQFVAAFQLVSGQNPDTSTRSQRARMTWTRDWSPRTLTDVSIGYDRVGSFLRPEPRAVGPLVSTAGLTSLGPEGSIPIDRAQNLFRYEGRLRRTAGTHSLSAGFAVLRRQWNGIETDAHRGFYSFANDFGRDAISNLRLGIPTQHIIALGDVHRGFRNWDLLFFAGDTWKASKSLALSYGLRYAPAPAPNEVNRRNEIAYDCDCNNVSPRLGLAWRLPKWARVLRAAYTLEHGEIYPVTFQQVRFTPPGSVKIVIPAPNLVDPFAGAGADPRPNLYLLDKDLALPYVHMYNVTWEFTTGPVRWQLGYAGSRAHKLLLMLYENRGHPAPGIPQTSATVNARRPFPQYAEFRRVVNNSRGYFDAARITAALPTWHGLTVDAAYWFSKSLDLGAAYTNTAYDADSRLSRSQWEFEQHRDMKGRSSFDQPHSALWRVSYEVRHWRVSFVALLKSGTPFNVTSGSDGPGFGNVDGNGGDRPNLLDASILGRTIGNPDTSRALLPRSAFAYMQPADTRGDLGRNVFRKGSIRNVNAAIGRTFRIRNGYGLEVRAESINLSNTPQFAEPGSELANPNFAQITNTLNEGRTFRAFAQLRW
jgi:hypothetical protein